MAISKPKWWFDAKGVEKAVKSASIERVAQAALFIEREVKTSMSVGVGSEKKRSKPGDIPHVETGILRSSIQSALLSALTYIIGPTRAAKYGKWLEFGTSRMAPRPFMFPALLEAIRKFRDLFKNLDLKRFYKAQKRIKIARGSSGLGAR